MKKYFVRLFDRIIKKPCNVIVHKDDLIFIIVTILENHGLNKRINVSTVNQSSKTVIEFKSTYMQWEQLVSDIYAHGIVQVSTNVTDQFGRSHNIELA